MKKNSEYGFTLGELLIVVAIIGVLSATSIPLFTAQLEKAKQSADLANMRSAKVAAIADYLYEGFGSEYRKYFNAGSGTMSDEIPDGYGRSSNNASEFASELNAVGYPNKDGVPSYITVQIDKDGNASLFWGTTYGAVYNSMQGLDIDGKWYDGPTRKPAYDNVISSHTAEERRKADIDVLNAIADYYNGLTVAEAQALFAGQGYNNAKGGGQQIFIYNVDNAYSVRLNPDGYTANMSMLENIGYKPNVYSKNIGEKTYFDYTPQANNYVDTYLFTSDEVIGTPSGSAKGIKVKFKEQDGVIVNAEVWINGTSLRSDVN